MTPGEVATYARQRYNAVNDDFYSDEEMYTHIWAAQNILARECNAIENVYETDTVASQKEYTYPTTALAIKRITYNGKKLEKISKREEDYLSSFDDTGAVTGTPVGYSIFDKTIYLEPTPDAAYTLKIYSFDMPGQVSSTSTLDVPSEFHLGLVNYLLWMMAVKDQNFQAATFYKEQWEDEKLRCLAWSRKRQVADGFNTVRDEDALVSRWDLP